MHVICLSSAGTDGASGLQPMQVDAKPQSHVFRYSLNYPNIGHCIIINNKNFDRRTGNTCFVLLKVSVVLFL